MIKARSTWTSTTSQIWYTLWPTCRSKLLQSHSFYCSSSSIRTVRDRASSSTKWDKEWKNLKRGKTCQISYHTSTGLSLSLKLTIKLSCLRSRRASNSSYQNWSSRISWPSSKALGSEDKIEVMRKEKSHSWAYCTNDSAFSMIHQLTQIPWVNPTWLTSLRLPQVSHTLPRQKVKSSELFLNTAKWTSQCSQR